MSDNNKIINTIANRSPCTANIPPKKIHIKNGNIASSAVFDTILKWGNGTIGDITISFDPSQGAKSALGIQSRNSQPSMNLGWVDPPTSQFKIDGYTFNLDFSNEYRNGCANVSSCNVGQTGTFLDGTPAVCVVNGVYCNPDFVPGSVVIHEFGHALGLYHEHQNYLNGNPIVYDTDGTTLFSLNQMGNSTCVEQYCKKLCYPDNVRPSFCDQDVLNHISFGCETDLEPSFSCQQDWITASNFAATNVLDVYDCPDGINSCRYDGSDFDPDSVMLYTVSDYMIKPNSQGVRVNPTKENFKLSTTDKDILGIMYPKNNTDKPTINVKFIDGDNWKKYWVKKIVTESIQPHVGINFVFDLPVAPPSTDEITPPPTTGVMTDESGSSFMKFFNDNTVLIIIILLFLLTVFMSFM